MPSTGITHTHINEGARIECTSYQLSAAKAIGGTNENFIQRFSLGDGGKADAHLAWQCSEWV